jgi:hypothetical protein
METIKSLFDFKFNKILTAKVLRILYAVVVGVCVLVAVSFVIVGLSENNIAEIILGPLGSIVYLMFFRIIFESVIIKFQMAQDIRDIKNKYVPSIPPPPSA